MEEFNISKDIPLFKDEKVNDKVKNLSMTLFRENSNVNSIIYNICALRKILKENSKVEIIVDSDFQTERGQVKVKYDFYDIMLRIFGFKKRTIQKILACEKFLEKDLIDNKTGLMKCFHGFSLTKMFELLPLKEKAIEYCQEGFLTSAYTVRELRLKVEELLGKETVQKDKNVNDFDLNEEYTLNDFKTRWTKTGLIDIAFSLYTNYRGYLLGQKKK